MGRCPAIDASDALPDERREMTAAESTWIPNALPERVLSIFLLAGSTSHIILAAMPSFDEALRRQEANQRSADAAQLDQENQRRRGADAAVPRVKQLLREFSQGLAQRGVRPVRLEIAKRRGLFHPALLAPAGYDMGSVYNGTWDVWDSIYLVTPDGELWSWSKHFSDSGKVVPITADNLASGNVRLNGFMSLKYDSDGNVFAFSNNRGEPISEPLEEFLAGCALRLINDNS